MEQHLMQETMQPTSGVKTFVQHDGVDQFAEPQRDSSIGRIVSVTGSKAIVLLDNMTNGRHVNIADRPEMGTLLAIAQQNTVVLAIVSALSVPVPSQGEGDAEIWIAELGLVGELQMAGNGTAK